MNRKKEIYKQIFQIIHSIIEKKQQKYKICHNYYHYPVV
jgi:hypothetical protein